MSYLVLARKCRPQIFEEVLGQNHVVQTLQNAIQTGRVAHAYLFSGPRGVGKTSIARIFAKALNCAEGPIPRPCNACVSCREITQGISLDVQEIDGASNRGIDDVRELRESIKYLPAQGRYKIYIVDEVHMLTGEAFNALLKTLEEPPRHAIFIFATTELNKVPLTIYSRCQSFNFRRISPDVIVGHLKKLTGDEKVTVEEQALRLITRQAEGSIRDALSLLDQILAFSSEEITEKQVQEILGFVDRRIIVQIGWALLENQLNRILELISEVYEFGYDLKQFLKDLIEHFRNLLLIKMGQDQGPLLDLTQEEIGEFKPALASISLDLLQDGLHFLIQSENELRRAAQPRLTLEMILLRLARLREVVPIEVVLQKLDQLERQGSWALEKNSCLENLSPEPAPHLREKKPAYSAAPVPKEADPEKEVSLSPQASAPPAPGPESFSKEALLEFVRQQNLPLATYLNHGEPRMADPKTLEWDFQDNAFHLEMLEGNSNKKKLEKICQDFFKRKIQVRFVGRGKEGQKSKPEPAPQKRKSFKETLENPLIKEFQDIFQAEIVDVKTSKETK